MGRVKKDVGMDWEGKTIAILGVAFKRDTNDIRNSPSINIAHHVQEQGGKAIHVYDPAAMSMFKMVHPESKTVKYFNHEMEALKGADIVIISTDWPQFRGLADMIIAESSKKTLIMDGRRILQHRYTDLQNAGFSIIPVGGTFIKGKAL